MKSTIVDVQPNDKKVVNDFHQLRIWFDDRPDVVFRSEKAMDMELQRQASGSGEIETATGVVCVSREETELCPPHGDFAGSPRPTVVLRFHPGPPALAFWTLRQAAYIVDQAYRHLCRCAKVTVEQRRPGA